MHVEAVLRSGSCHWFDAVFRGSWRSWFVGSEFCVGGPETRPAETT